MADTTHLGMCNQVVALALALLAGCRAPGAVAAVQDAGGARLGPAAVTTLDTSLSTLRADFNAHKDQPRVVSLLSPTCGTCRYGVGALRSAVLEAFPDADLHVQIVWLDMLPNDRPSTACEAAQRLDDPRVRHFHDPSKAAGRAFARGLLPVGVAWDVYLFYPAGVEWLEEPPRPVAWSHQLGRVDPEHFHPRERLRTELRASAERILATGDGTEGPGGPMGGQ